MTDKQIIIDGVDVSECINRNDLKFASYNCYLNGGCQCKDNPNCYYKQLKRSEAQCEAMFVFHTDLEKKCKTKEQECKNAQSELVEANKQVIYLAKQLDQLKAELEQEKALKETYLTCYKAKHEDIDGELFKLKQTLTEIKEVLQFYNNTTIGTDKGNGIFEFEVSNDNILGGKFIYCYDTNPAKKALQKISEAIK